MKKKINKLSNRIGMFQNRNTNGRQKKSTKKDGFCSIKAEDSNHWMCKYGFKTVLDIGANEGQFARKITNIIPGINLVCFEPLREPFKILKKNFSGANNRLFQYALGTKEAEINIYRNEFSPSSSILPMAENHKINFSFAKKEFPEKIQIKILDNVAEKIAIERPFIVKIDVQGYEMKVIEGGNKTINEADMVIIETSFFQLYEDGPLFHDVYSFLHKIGFEYAGSFEQLLSPISGVAIQQDAIFVKPKLLKKIEKQWKNQNYQ